MTKNAIAAALLLCATAAGAGPTPTSGSLDANTKGVVFSGGPFVVPNPSADRYYLGTSEAQQLTPLICHSAAQNCDSFVMAVALPTSARQAAGAHRALRFAVVGMEPMPLPLVQPSFDVFLFDSQGLQLARSGEYDEATAQHYFDLPLEDVPNGQYSVIVTAYDAMGASYQASVKLVEIQ